MRPMLVKSEAQQASGLVFHARDLLARSRTQCANALRGHLSEHGHVFPQGITCAGAVIASIEDPTPWCRRVRTILAMLLGTFQALEA